MNANTAQYSKRSIYRTWLLLCFTTGPVSSMSRTYIPAVLQSMARSQGKNSDDFQCSPRGNDCFIWLGSWKVRSNSYVLYLKALYTLIEAVISLLIMNIADYSSFKKWIICCCTVLYGALVIPFVGCTEQDSKSQLIAFSVLYCLVHITNTVLQIMEASYIPNFMRDIRGDEITVERKGKSSEQVRRYTELKKGSKVSAMGLTMTNLSGIAALLTGIIVTYSHTSTGSKVGISGFKNFLIAITTAGLITLVLGASMFYLIPSIKNKTRPKDEWLIFITIKRTWELLKAIQKYPNAFKLCIGWVIWNLTNSTFMSVFVLLFRSTLGIGNSDAEYTIYTFMAYTLACIGSLSWMFAYPRASLSIKTWAYIFLSISLITNFWGCLGISGNTKVGFKHRWEFWTFESLYTMSASALRSLNRCLYSSILPIGEEVQYFGLEIILGTLVNWGVDFLMAFIQDKTDNDRYPFLLNLFLVVISIVFYKLCDSEQGMKDAEKFVENMEQNLEEMVEEIGIKSTKSSKLKK